MSAHEFQKLRNDVRNLEDKLESITYRNANALRLLKQALQIMNAQDLLAS